MPYISLKVSHDLYEELGLSPSMELICSNGSVKLIPVSNKRVLGDYESPLLTSPIFGNRPSDKKETVPGVLSSVLPSTNATVFKKLQSSHEVSVDPLDVAFPSSLANTSMSTTSQLNIGTNDISCIELDSRGRLSSVTLTASQSTAASQQEVNPLFSTPDEKTVAPVEEIKCDECFKVFEGKSVCQRYKRHKKVCDERKEKRLKAAKMIVIPECDPEIPEFLLLDDVSQTLSCDEIKVNPECNPEEPVIEQKVSQSFICECRLSFQNQLYYNIHVKKCKYLKKKSTSSNIERIAPPCAAPVSNDPIVHGTDKYISIEKHPEFAYRFFIRKKDTD